MSNISRNELLIRIVSYVLILPLQGFAESEFTSDEKTALFNYRYDELKAPLVSFESVRMLVEKHGLKSIDELLPLLPLEYRKFYTRVYASKSLQGASFRFPRIIFYGPDAQTVIAVTGHADMNNGELLEMIEWDNSQSRFVFREIVFPEKDFATKPVHFDGKPQRCIRCHQKDLRPNWDAYRFWRGIYGSRGAGGMDEIAKGSPEYKGWLDFVDQAGAKYRYQHLPLVTKFTEKSLKIMETRIPKSFVPVNGAITDPNIFFNQQLGELNRRRIARILKDHPLFKHFKYALTFSEICIPIFNNDNAERLIKSTLPPRVVEAGEPYRDVFQSHSDRVISERVKRYAEVEILNPKPKEESPSENYSGMNQAGLKDGQQRRSAALYYIFSLMNLDFSDWSMGFDRALYDFASGINDGVSHGRSLFIALKDQPEIRPFLARSDVAKLEGGKQIYGFSESDPEKCHCLAEKSQAALSQWLNEQGHRSPDAIRPRASRRRFFMSGNRIISPLHH